MCHRMQVRLKWRLMKTVKQGKIHYLQPAWAGQSNLVTGFTMRNGGSSRPPFNSLNLGFGSGDQLSQVEANRAAVATGTGKSISKTGHLVIGRPALAICQEIAGYFHTNIQQPFEKPGTFLAFRCIIIPAEQGIQLIKQVQAEFGAPEDLKFGEQLVMPIEPHP